MKQRLVMLALAAGCIVLAVAGALVYLGQDRKAPEITVEDTEISYWLFNTAELWANSGIEVKKGDVLTIRASGASHTAIHHLVEDAGSNKTLRDKWVGTGGTRPTGSTRDKYRREYRIARNLPEGILLMGVADMDYEDSENGYGIDW